MKKIGIFTAALLIGLTTAFAQSEKQPVREVKKGHPHAKAKAEKQERHMTNMDKTVNLSEEQKAEIAKINKASTENTRAIRMSYKDKEDKSGMKAEMKKAQDERQNKVHSVLTEEQKKKMEESKVKKEASKPIHSPK